MNRFDDSLTAQIIACIIRVHQALGPGFLESVYRRALVVEMRRRGLVTDVEHEVRIYYEECEVGHHRLDLLVEKQVIIELKAVEALASIHYAQVRSYLNATKLNTGILVNFADERADFRRIERK